MLIYQGNIGENSFNLNIHEGVARFFRTSGVRCEELVVGFDPDSYNRQLESVARQGYNPIVLVYGSHFDRLQKFIKQYPDIRFIVLGTVEDEPNLFSMDFAEHEGSFLAGALAAMTTKTNVLAFVSVSDLPLMRRFACGFEQGAKHVNPDVTVLTGFTGSYPGAWFDGNATAALANQFMDQGADVVFQVAGAAGPAVLEAAARRGRLGIGVDRNQNGLYPGHVLTSMIKRTDKAIFAALMLAWRGVWRDNIKTFGLAQEGVDLVFDEHNAALVPSTLRSRIDTLKSRIVLGEIRVHDYVKDLRCP
ncbi:BMP family ABC transporter substrate-binding protein [Megalodesulfovibrio paquesii]